MHFIHLADKSSGCEKYEITFHISIALQIKKQMGKGSIQFKVQNPHPVVAVVVFRHFKQFKLGKSRRLTYFSTGV